MCNLDDSGRCVPDISRHHVSPLQTLAWHLGLLLYFSFSVVQNMYWVSCTVDEIGYIPRGPNMLQRDAVAGHA